MFLIKNKQSSEQSEENCRHKHHDNNVNIAKPIARGCVLGRHIIVLTKHFATHSQVKEVNSYSTYTTPKNAANNIGGVMQAEIHSSIAVDERPKHKSHAQDTTPYNHAEKQR